MSRHPLVCNLLMGLIRNLLTFVEGEYSKGMARHIGQEYPEQTQIYKTDIKPCSSSSHGIC